jgi:hypothetical protein
MRWHLSQPFKVAVLVLAGWAIVLVSCELTLPPLMKGLISGDDPSADSVFNERVQLAFPMGLPEAELLRILEKQGFECSERSSGGGRLCKSFAYGAHWVVFWKTDKAGALAKVEGRRWVKSL